MVGVQMAPKATEAVCSRQESKAGERGLGGWGRAVRAQLPLLCRQAAHSRAPHSVSSLYCKLA